MMTPTTTYSSQYLVDMIGKTDLLTPDEKQKFIHFMPNFTQEERNLLGTQIMNYERRKQEIIKDAEERKRKIEEEYYKELQNLHAQEQKRIRDDLKAREQAEQDRSEQEALELLNSV